MGECVMAGRTSTLLPALLLVLALESVCSTRCYMCRDVVQKRGQPHIFKDKYDQLKTDGWIIPCTDESFVAYPQVSCKKRVYTTQELCYPEGRCNVKIKERYPMIPPTYAQKYFSKSFRVNNIKEDRECREDLCNGEWKNQHDKGLKCYHQCGKIDLRGLTDDELQNYDLPVIPCDESTYNYCSLNQECGYVEGRAKYYDENYKRNITVVGWYADCFFKHSDSIDHVLDTIMLIMKDHPSLKISPDDLTKCGTELCNHIE